MTPPPVRRPVLMRGQPAARPVVTPYKNEMGFDTLMCTMEEMRTMYTDFMAGKTLVEKVLARFEAVTKGDTGAPGLPGIQGRQGITGKAGRDVQQADVEAAVRKYLRQPKDGVAPSVEQVTQAVLASPKLFKFIQKKLKELESKEPQETTQPVETIALMVLEGLKGKIKWGDIDGLEAKFAEIRNQTATAMRGGGDTVVAGAGIMIRNTINGNKEIISTATGLSIIAVSGTINDSNVAFTAPSEPTLLCINGGFYQKTGGAITWTYLAGAITLSSAVGTGGSIFGI